MLIKRKINILCLKNFYNYFLYGMYCLIYSWEVLSIKIKTVNTSMSFFPMLNKDIVECIR